MPGVPRATYMPFPFQVFQNESSVFMAYEFAGAVRDIYLHDVGPAETDSWMGQSVGHWEGDTLVVEVTGQSDQTWFDRSGSHHTNQLRVVERYTMMSANHLQYEATMEDPAVFTEPWTISMPLYRRVEDGARLMTSNVWSSLKSSCSANFVAIRCRASSPWWKCGLPMRLSG